MFDLGRNETTAEIEDGKEASQGELVRLELTNEEFNKYKGFCDKINKHLTESGYKKFKANHFFSLEYFQGCSDDQILEYYKIAEYLHSEVLKQSLNWYLGGLFKDLSLEEVENIYLEAAPKDKKVALSKKSNKEEARFLDNPGDFSKLEFAEFLNSKLVEELDELIPKFGTESISFMDEWLIGPENHQKQHLAPGEKTGGISINEN